MNSSSPDPRVEAIPITTPWPVLAVVTVLTGLAAGLSGMLLALLLHVVQHSAYSYGAVHSDESFLQGVMNSSPLRRLLALSICGVVAGLGWWAIRRFGSPLVSIGNAVSAAKRMPALTTVAHDLLQIVTVGWVRLLAGKWLLGRSERCSVPFYPVARVLRLKRAGS